jgi:flagellar basal body rod protein FlgG
LNDGQEIEIRLDDGAFSVAKDGTISQNGREINRIGVVAFDRPQNLQHGNGSYFIDSGNDAGVRPVEQPKVLQGQLQMSTVNPLREMVNMIEVSRAYELTQKMIQGEDQRMEKAIQAFSV